MENHASQVDDLVERERASVRSQFSKELQETKWQTHVQKKEKEMIIKREKTLRDHLKRLERCADPETMNPMRLYSEATQPNPRREKKKKVLQNKYEDLQVALMVSQNNFCAEVQAEEEKNSALQQERARLTAEHQDQVREEETKKEALKEQVGELKAQLKSAESLSSCEEEKLKQLSTDLDRQAKSFQEQVEKNLLFQEEMSTLQEQVLQLTAADAVNQAECSITIQAEDDENQALWKELENLRNLIQTLQDDAAQKERHITELQAEQKVQAQDEPNNSPHDSPDTEMQECIEGSVESKIKKPSVWKRCRHFFGLRKKNKRDKVED